MALENIVDRTEIKFPKPLNADAIQSFFEHLTSEGIAIHYTLEEIKEVHAQKTGTMAVHVQGNAYRGVHNIRFTLEKHSPDLLSYKALKFYCNGGGGEYAEYDAKITPEEFEIIDKLRKRVAKYFGP